MITKPKGTNDLLLDDSFKWQYIEQKYREICTNYGYYEIRTPMFEHTELFLRGVGQTTDIVQKEMYTFEDRGGRSITLKPEGTAGVARAYIENKLYADVQPTKMYYITPAFRCERPQSGRYRQFEQLGLEMYGSKNPATDAEVISLIMNFFDGLGIKGLKLNINSIGCPECRAKYNEALKAYFKDNIQDMCSDCRERYDNNPLRLLDCKVPICKEIGANAPVILDYLCDECKEHFEGVKSYLEILGIDYNVNPKIVRGLDYYTKTVIEVVSTEIGAQGTICGGGRYDGLVEECGGPQTPAVGFAIGVERLLMVLEAQGLLTGEKHKADIFIASIGAAANKEAFKIAATLRKQNVYAEFDHIGRSVKAQMRYADKIHSRYTCVLGDNELDTRIIKLKDMETGEAKEISIDELTKIFGGNN